jgi:hypothetical protein
MQSFFKLSLSLFLVWILSIDTTNAQISEIKELSKATKSITSDVFSGGGSDFGFFFADVIGEIFIYSFVDGHRRMMQRRNEEPWLLSLDIGLHGGYYSNQNASILSPSIRGNWGIFSSQFRYNKFQDFTASFPTLDWQILQFNIVAHPGVNFRVGSGFMHEIDNNESYYEQFLGLELHLNQRKINPIVELRWAEDFETQRTARFELNTRINFFLAHYGRINVNLMTGFLYQKYYEQENFYFAQAGLTFNIY